MRGRWSLGRTLTTIYYLLSSKLMLMCWRCGSGKEACVFRFTVSPLHEWVSEWVKSLSRVRLFATPWTVAHQAPLSTRFPRQECWRGLPFPSPGDLPHPGIGPASLELALDFFATEPGDVPAPLQGQNSCSICRYLQRLVCVENRKESFSGDKWTGRYQPKSGLCLKLETWALIVAG